MPAARTTTRRTTSKTVAVDLDDLLADALGDASVVNGHVPFKLFGEVFHADGNFNVIRILQSDLESESGIEEQVRELVVAKDRERFMKTLAAQPRLTGPMISAIIQKVTEIIADRPTK